jgi:hypothetical protein
VARFLSSIVPTSCSALPAGALTLALKRPVNYSDHSHPVSRFRAACHIACTGTTVSYSFACYFEADGGAQRFDFIE